MATPAPQFDTLGPTEMLELEEVEVRAKIKKSLIYELIEAGEFPAPVRLGGVKWVAAEVEEYLRRCIEKRDRERGENRFVPRAQVLQFPKSAIQNAPSSIAAVMDSATANESTLRVLSSELCHALRTLRIDIPELYLNEDSWQVNLLVMKVDRKPAAPINNEQAGKHRVKKANQRT